MNCNCRLEKQHTDCRLLKLSVINCIWLKESNLTAEVTLIKIVF